MKRVLGWSGMVARETCIEMRAKLLTLCDRLNDAVNWLDSFECVGMAVSKHRGIEG